MNRRILSKKIFAFFLGALLIFSFARLAQADPDQGEMDSAETGYDNSMLDSSEDSWGSDSFSDNFSGGTDADAGISNDWADYPAHDDGYLAQDDGYPAQDGLTKIATDNEPIEIRTAVAEAEIPTVEESFSESQVEVSVGAAFGLQQLADVVGAFYKSVTGKDPEITLPNEGAELAATVPSGAELTADIPSEAELAATIPIADPLVEAPIEAPELPADNSVSDKPSYTPPSVMNYI